MMIIHPSLSGDSTAELKKTWYVNPDPKSKSCDFQVAVFIFMSRRLILNCLN